MTLYVYLIMVLIETSCDVNGGWSTIVPPERSKKEEMWLEIPKSKGRQGR